MISGAMLRIAGAVLGGVALILLGMWIGSTQTFVDPQAAFQALANILYISGVAVMLTGVGWTLQTWARS